MPPYSEKLAAWIKVWKSWPLWAQVSSAAGLFVLVALALLLASSAAPSASANGGNDPTGLALNVFFKLSVVIIIIFSAGFIVRRLAGGRWKTFRRQVNVVETVHLSPRRSLHLIQIGDRQFLIGATDQAISLVSEIDAGEQIEKSLPATSFADMLTMNSQPTDQAAKV